ncbi:MAG: TetR/AcrR family transcriptional regulator [Rhodospirillales bacterium]|nr:TetR/AcrR family transcriptional regulator [Rhodospirillales bacterium]
MSSSMSSAAAPNARDRILGAAIDLIRREGFAATSLDDLCRQAGVTKGAFFHHFAGKEDLGVAAADFWREGTSALFANAPYHRPADPLARVLAYLDFRRELVRGGVPEFTCLVGTLVQETYDSHPRIRDACAASIFGHAQTLEADIAAAMKKHRVTAAGWTPESLATHTQTVLQGAFILAKAKNDPALVFDAIDHLERYIRFLFKPKKKAAAA